MVGRARETTSSAIAGVKERFEGRVARASESYERARARLEALRELREKLGKYASAPEGARESIKMATEVKLHMMKSEGLITREEYEQFMEGLGEPEKTIETLERMMKDEEYKVQVRKADLNLVNSTLGLLAGAVEKIRSIPQTIRQYRNRILAQLELAGGQEEERRRKRTIRE
jgi:chromosome segregation ATPase